MRSWVLLVVLFGCSDPKPGQMPVLQDNPLDAIDPRVGFVADAFASTGAALEEGRLAQVSESNRILSISDPLGVARLAAEVERERAYCKTPPCPIDTDVTAALTSYSQKSDEYAPILVAHHDALAAWAAIAAAHQALAIANVLDQAGTLGTAGRTEIRAAADALTTAGVNALASKTLDWSQIMAATTASPLINDEIMRHAPTTVPLPGIETAANAVVSAVLVELDREGPNELLCCKETLEAPIIGTYAYQALRRIALLREWAARGDAATAIDTYRAGLVTLASKILSGTSDSNWVVFRNDALLYARVVSSETTMFDAASFIADPDLALVGIGAQYDDPNARKFVPNVAALGPAQGPSWQDMPPSLQVATSWSIPHIADAMTATYSPDYLGDPPPAAAMPNLNDGASETPPANTVALEWTVRAAAPIDHLDLQIARAGGEPFVHYIERPRSTTFPMRTLFDPVSMDPDAPQTPPSTPLRVDYVITAVVVDTHGHASDRVTVPFRVSFRERPPFADYLLFLEDGEPVRATANVRFRESDDIPTHSLPPEQVTIRPYSTTTGPAIHFEPSYVRIQSTTGSLTVVNLDTNPHHLRAVYTPPYTVDPTLASVSIGGAAPIDLGLVLAGNSVSVPLPAGAVDHTYWTLYEADAARPQAFRLTVDLP